MLAGIYLHIPFCQVRCSYCDFNTYTGLEALIPGYTDALRREASQVARGASVAGIGQVEVDTIYFGGGTPSLLPVEDVRAILSVLRAEFRVRPGTEVTLEANPGTVGPRQLTALHEQGVNRLSFGVQSAQANELRLLGRLHTFDQAVEAVRWARQAGFENVSVDLIYGIMGQTLSTWQDTLRRALELVPEHLSLYALTVESGTPLHARVQAGDLLAPDPDLAADMYEWAREELRGAGFRHYEISNWARARDTSQDATPTFACRHNLGTWRLQPYLGLGAGAHGFVPGWRYANVRHPAEYVQRMRNAQGEPFPYSPALEEKRPIDEATEQKEMLLLGLRLVEEGVSIAAFERRYGMRPDAIFGATLRELAQKGLLELTSERVRLTPWGHLLGNLVFGHFV